MGLEEMFQDYLPDWFENRTEAQKQDFWKKKTVLYENGVASLGTLTDNELQQILNTPVSQFLPFGHNKPTQS